MPLRIPGFIQHIHQFLSNAADRFVALTVTETEQTETGNQHASQKLIALHQKRIAPFRAAATAAITPLVPPPTTTTSACNGL